MEKYKTHKADGHGKSQTPCDGDGQPRLDLDIPHERIGTLVDVGGVLVPDASKGAERSLQDMTDGGGVTESAGRSHSKKSARKLGKKWRRLAAGLPEASIRTSFMGGIVAVWKGSDTVSLEFSRRLKRAWIDVSSPHGDWGMEFELDRGGWKKLGKRLRKIVGRSQ